MTNKSWYAIKLKHQTFTLRMVIRSYGFQRIIIISQWKSYSRLEYLKPYNCVKVSLFNDISNFEGYLILKKPLEKNSSDTIEHITRG